MKPLAELPVVLPPHSGVPSAPAALGPDYPSPLARAGSGACHAAHEFFHARMSTPPPRLRARREGLPLLVRGPGPGADAGHAGPGRPILPRAGRIGPDEEPGALGGAALLRRPGDASRRLIEPFPFGAGDQAQPRPQEDSGAHGQPRVIRSDDGHADAERIVQGAQAPDGRFPALFPQDGTLWLGVAVGSLWVLFEILRDPDNYRARRHGTSPPSRFQHVLISVRHTRRLISGCIPLQPGL